MAGTASISRSEAWSSYWSSGAPHSLPGSLAVDGGKELSRLWAPVFASLDEASRVLDVGTGSGIVPRLALALAPQAFHLDAIDLVDVAPPSFPRAPYPPGRSLRFHGGVAAEHLPFEDAAFELVVSQFGIEYADLVQAGAAVRRVLKPGGRVAFLVHSTTSVAVQHARAEAPHSDWLLSAGGLFDQAAHVLPFFALASSAEGRAALAGDPRALAARDAFNHAARTAEDRANEYGGALCADALSLVSQAIAASRVRAEDGTKALETARIQVAQAALRSRELVACALDERGAIALAAGAGVPRPSVIEAQIEGHALGWWITGGVIPSVTA